MHPPNTKKILNGTSDVYFLEKIPFFYQIRLAFGKKRFECHLNSVLFTNFFITKIP